jgi:S-adenosyl methyltransferase
VTEDLSLVPEGIDEQRPSIARVYDHLLGGSHNFPVDRKVAEDIIALEPDTIAIASALRAWLGRAVEYMVKAGVRQFLDIGPGMPTQQNTHQVAQAAAPGARVVYVDFDPETVTLSKGILAGNPDADMIQGDLRDPGKIIADPEVRRLLDFGEPVGLVISSVLHFISDDEDPWRILSAFREAIAAGSYLAISHITYHDEDVAAQIETTYESQVTRTGFRSREAIERFFDGFDLLEPGVVSPAQWRSDSPQDTLAMWTLAGLARRP